MKAQGVRPSCTSRGPTGDSSNAWRRTPAIRAVALAPAVGATRQATSYLDMFEFNVNALAQALR